MARLVYRDMLAVQCGCGRQSGRSPRAAGKFGCTIDPGRVLISSIRSSAPSFIMPSPDAPRKYPASASFGVDSLIRKFSGPCT